MDWIAEEASSKGFDYLIEHNQFMEKKPYRCVVKNKEYNSPWFQTGLWCYSASDAMINGDNHNERIIE